jgi:hypothetical protein
MTGESPSRGVGSYDGEGGAGLGGLCRAARLSRGRPHGPSPDAIRRPDLTGVSWSLLLPC